MRRHKARVVIGCPGAGKSTFLAREARKLANKDPLLLSFTRSAAGVIEAKLGWGRDAVKTIHAHCYRELEVGKGQMMTGSRILEFCAKIKLPPPTNSFEIYTPETHPFEIYNYAKTADIPLIEAYLKYQDTTEYGYDRMAHFVKSLQNFKEANGIYEFDDLLSRYQPVDVPKIIMVDEAQDLSPKLTAVLRKMVEAGVEEIWMVGDPNQSIYTYAGADPRLMYSFGKNIEQYLDKSYRCPAAVVAKAKEIFPEAQFISTEEEGSVKATRVFPAGAGLILARTNYLANRLAKQFGEGGKIRTMHKAKGLEADHVILVNSQTKRVMASAAQDPEAEKRVLYTAITRARKTLTIYEDKNHYDCL